MNILVKIDSFKEMKRIANVYGVRDVTIQYYKEQMKSGYRLIDVTELSNQTLRTYSNENKVELRKLKPFIILGKIKC